MSDLRVALTFDAGNPGRRQCPPGAAEAILTDVAVDDWENERFVTVAEVLGAG